MLLFLPAAVLVAASPGANNLLALRHGVHSGTRTASAALIGRLAGFLILVTLAAAGLGALLATSQVAFEVLRWAGVAYLGWLGLRALLRPQAPDRDGADAPVSWRPLARREFTVVLTNPKAMLLFTAFLPQFVDTTRPVGIQLLGLGCVYFAVEMVAASGYAALGGRLGALRLGERAYRNLDRLTGGLLLAAAGLLATARRAPA